MASHERSVGLGALAVALSAAVASAQARQFALDTPAVIAAKLFQRVTTADVDGDGDQDVIGSSVLPIGNGVQLLRNDGAGVFVDVTTAQLPVLAQGVATVLPFDADGDGDVDLFVGGLNAPSFLWRNVGGGSFVVGQGLGFAASTVDAVAADLDGDGDLDLALSGSWLYSSIDRIAVNDGSGTFSAGPPLGSSFTGLVSALDFDGDGDSDLAFTSAPLTLLRNDGNLVFVDVTASQLVAPQAMSPGQFVVGDLDGDGDPDLVLRGVAPAPDLVAINVGGVFTAVGLMPPQPSTGAMAVADVDRDGDLDVVRTHLGAGVSLALNDGAGAFSDGGARLPLQPVFASGVCLADLDRDGDPELLTSLFPTSTLVLQNRHVDIGVGVAAIGQPWTVTLGSEPGYATQPHVCRLAVGLAALPQPLALPGFGELWVDLSWPLVRSDGVIAPAAGQEAFSFVIPNGPALVGLTLHVQGLVEQAPGPARLTAYRPVVIQ